MRKSDYPKVLRRGVAVMVILSLLLLLLSAFAPAAMAADWPNCDWGCTANDTDVTRAWLGNCTTQANLSSCTAGTPVKACIFADFHNTASADRYQAFVLFDLYINEVYNSSIEKCVVDTIPPGDTSYNVYTLNWTCGDRVELRNFTLTWTTQKVGPNPCTCNNTSCCTGGGCKCQHQKSKCYAGNFTVEAPLVANFTHNAPQCYCTNINFYGTATGGKKPYVNWTWDFDDGSYSYQQNTSHHYGAAGTYNVTLTVTDSNTTPNTANQSYNVTVYENPTASFTSNSPQCLGTDIDFDGSASNGTGPYTYDWDFGDGTGTSTIEDPSYKYAANGTYTVNLTVNDTNGCKGYYEADVEVYENPTASFTSNSPQCLGTDIDFDGSASGGTGPYTYDWDFGDGTGTSTIEDPSYKYAANGTYTVNLTVNDTNGCKGYYEADVEVYENPTASFTSNSPQCLGTDIDFDGSASGGTGPYTYDWDFGDGTGTSTIEDPSYKYAANGTYTVNLTVNDTNGCKGYYEADVEVYENPTASFTSNSPQCLGTDIDFDGSASGGTGPYTYDWDFGDGTGTSTIEDPSYKYAANGTYTVNLTVNDTNGYKGYYEADVEVYENPTASFTSNSPQCLGTDIDFDGSASGGTGPYIYLRLGLW